MMRIKFFFFTMLASITTSAQVTNVTPISVNYTNKTVAFRVWWNNGTRDAKHLSIVWIWVDYLTVNSNNTISGNTWIHADVSAASVSPTATISYDGNNRRGFWLQGASGSYSAVVTVQLDVTARKFNWCAYASDYPPHGTLKNEIYTLYGSPPFTLVAADGTTTQQVNGYTIPIAALTIAPVTLTDKTGCPGTPLCPYPGDDLFIDDTHHCRPRKSGEKNWEAWIKDARDNELYRIVLMPDNKWWLAQNLKYDANKTMGVLFQSCGKDSCGQFYTAKEVFDGDYTNVQAICPDGWVIPNTDQWDQMSGAISNDLIIAWQDLRSLQAPCSPITDRYGWATKGRCPITKEDADGDSWHSMKKKKWVAIQLDNGDFNELACHDTHFWNCTVCDKKAYIAVRCMRP
jgi:uncharacterized protein (TIGR02145 family)